MENSIWPITALKTATSIYGDIELKKEQKEVLEYVYKGRDYIAVLPTGFGKSDFSPYPLPVPTKISDSGCPDISPNGGPASVLEWNEHKCMFSYNGWLFL